MNKHSIEQLLGANMIFLGGWCAGVKPHLFSINSVAAIILVVLGASVLSLAIDSEVNEAQMEGRSHSE